LGYITVTLIISTLPVVVCRLVEDAILHYQIPPKQKPRESGRATTRGYLYATR